MANPYPVEVEDDSGTVVARGAVTFIDPANQPGGGGSQPNAVIVRKFAFAFDSAGLANGIPIGTVALNDVVLDAWVEHDSWDGTTPLCDFGCDDYSDGCFSGAAGAVDMTNQDLDAGRGGLWQGTGAGSWSIVSGGAINGAGVRLAPTRVALGGTWKVWVSQDGTKGGAAAGATQGTAILYVMTATPSAFA